MVQVTPAARESLHPTATPRPPIRHTRRTPDVPRLVTVSVEVEDRFVPAARDAVQELRDKIATKMQGAGTYQAEDAWTGAYIVAAAFAAALERSAADAAARAEREGRHADARALRGRSAYAER